MLTFQGMRDRTNYMMESIRRSAIDETLKQFKTAATKYYTDGYDNGETVKLIHELESFGVDSGVIFDIEWEIREQCGAVRSRKEGKIK